MPRHDDWVYCPVHGDYVNAGEMCVDCPLHDEEGCTLKDAGRGSTRRELRRLHRRVTRSQRLRRRGGRRLKLPLAPETWPRGDAAEEEPLMGPVPEESEELGGLEGDALDLPPEDPLEDPFSDQDPLAAALEQAEHHRLDEPYGDEGLDSSVGPGALDQWAEPGALGPDPMAPPTPDLPDGDEPGDGG